MSGIARDSGPGGGAREPSQPMPVYAHQGATASTTTRSRVKTGRRDGGVGGAVMGGVVAEGKEPQIMN